MLSAYQLVRVFGDSNGAQGNHAAIFVQQNNSEQALQPENMSANLYKEKNIVTTCFISELGDKHYEVNCFNGNQAIQCCGHGMIAAAKVIFDNNSESNIIINDGITASHVNDMTDHDIVMLTLPRLSAQLQTVPDWLNSVFTLGDEKLIPNRAAVSEKEDGYLLLEFEPALSLDVFRAMQLDLQHVCDNTKRAIVVVQFDQKNERLAMRYFAPQYGVPEDSATGSVMRFVADYIEQRYQSTHFEVNQCSSQGGFMKVECMTEHIKITANARMELR